MVSGVYYSKGLSSGSVTTLAGKSVMITAFSGKYHVTLLKIILQIKNVVPNKKRLHNMFLSLFLPHADSPFKRSASKMTTQAKHIHLMIRRANE